MFRNRSIQLLLIICNLWMEFPQSISRVGRLSLVRKWLNDFSPFSYSGITHLESLQIARKKLRDDFPFCSMAVGRRSTFMARFAAYDSMIHRPSRWHLKAECFKRTSCDAVPGRYCFKSIACSTPSTIDSNGLIMIYILHRRLTVKLFVQFHAWQDGRREQWSTALYCSSQLYNYNRNHQKKNNKSW